MRLINADELERVAIMVNGRLVVHLTDIHNAPTVEPEITNDDLQAAMTESYHLGYELAETKFKRPQGKWINEWREIKGGRVYGACCSLCHINGHSGYNFCPKCGADMRNKGEEK